jgi:hypothetical protein
MTPIRLDAVPAVFDPGQAVVSGIGGALGGAAGFGIDAVLRGFTSFVAQGASYLLGQLATIIDQTTSPAIGDQWFIAHYQVMVGLAVLLVLPMLLASAVSAIIHSDPSALVRAVLLQLPLAMVGTGIAVQLVILALAATDQLCAMVTGGTSSDLKGFLSTLGHLVDGTSFPANGGFAVLLASAVLAFGALLMCIEMIVRTDAVYVAVLFLPLALAGLVWPATVRWGRRLVETLVVLILSKFVVVAIVSLAASAVSASLQSAPGGDGFPALIAGLSLLLLAAFAPYALLRLVPIVEAGMVGHLEGAGRRAMPSTRNLASAARLASDPSSLDGVLQRAGPGGGDGDETPADGSPSPFDDLRHVGRSEDWDQFRGLVTSDGEHGLGDQAAEPLADGRGAAVRAGAGAMAGGAVGADLPGPQAPEHWLSGGGPGDGD